MRQIRQHSGTIAASVTVFVILAIVMGAYAYWCSPSRGLPYHDSFAAGKADEWKALGGTWELSNGAMRNDSDERGAKLLTGSTHWQNYSIEADVMLLGLGGDAGVIVRSNNEEEGVDAYEGYYAGLRTIDNGLTLGRAGYGWMEANFPLKTVPLGVQASRWYHLKLLAYGCRIVAAAGLAGAANPTVVSIADDGCIRSGRVGLRSYSSGGVWRNLAVRASTKEEMEQMLAVSRSQQSLSAQKTTDPAGSGQVYLTPPADNSPRALPTTPNTQPISGLRMMPYGDTGRVTVRGIVILNSQALFVQDTTGGVAVEQVKPKPLKVGDEVEVTGGVQPSAFSSKMVNATVRVLWEGTPTPAVSITASQAATGAFDATFIEVSGRLKEKETGKDDTLVFNFESDSQAFRAIMNRGRGNSLYNELNPGSIVRLRGVAVADHAYTRDKTPFAVLVRSSDDVEVLAGPPWWSAEHLTLIGVGLLLISVMTYVVFHRVENLRLRAVLEERQRLAYEMHDTLAQSVAGIGFQLEAIRIGTPNELAKVHQQLDLASDLVRQSHAEARRSIMMLRPQQFEAEGLVDALNQCAARLVEGGEVRIASNRSGTVYPLPLRVVDALYRIGQEALANAVRHSQPTSLLIQLEYEKNAVQLVIEDDGCGFIRDGHAPGLGVLGMQQRADSIGAKLDIQSEDGRGTKVRVRTAIVPRLTITSLPAVLLKILRGKSGNVITAGKSDSRSYS